MGEKTEFIKAFTAAVIESLKAKGFITVLEKEALKDTILSSK